MFLTNSAVEDKNSAFTSLLKQDTISKELLLSVMKEIGNDTARLAVRTIEK
jgi:hypothetical protein